MKIKYFWIAALLMSTGTFVQCSGQSDEDIEAVQFEPIPTKPIVINATFTYTTPPINDSTPPQVMTVQGPWFKFKYAMLNKSNMDLVIQTIRFYIQAVDGETGSLLTYTSSLDSGSLPQNENDTTADDQPYLVAIPAGQGEEPPISWYIDGLPFSNGSSYTVEAEAIGWFGSPTNPIKAFAKKILFSTEKPLGSE